MQFSYWYCMTLSWNSAMGPKLGSIQDYVRFSEHPDPNERFLAALAQAKIEIGIKDEQSPTVMFYCYERAH